MEHERLTPTAPEWASREIDRLCDERAKRIELERLAQEAGVRDGHLISDLRAELANARLERDNIASLNSSLIAELAEAKAHIAELEARLNTHKNVIAAADIRIVERTARAERAEAEREELREAGTAALKDLEYFSRREGPGGDASRFASIYKLRAALAPSPANEKLK